MTATDIATEALLHFGDVCQDVAFGKPWEEAWNSDARSWHHNAKAEGCQDFRGAYTDFLYNDPALAEDILGDRLSDECSENDALHDAAVGELERIMGWMPPFLFKNLRKKQVDA